MNITANSWIISNDGDVFVIIDGVEMQVDAVGSLLAQLAPGRYTNDEALAAIRSRHRVEGIAIKQQ